MWTLDKFPLLLAKAQANPNLPETNNVVIALGCNDLKVTESVGETTLRFQKVVKQVKTAIPKAKILPVLSSQDAKRTLTAQQPTTCKSQIITTLSKPLPQMKKVMWITLVIHSHLPQKTRKDITCQMTEPVFTCTKQVSNSS